MANGYWGTAVYYPHILPLPYDIVNFCIPNLLLDRFRIVLWLLCNH